MDRFIITIRPSSSDEALLRVDDAMHQVLDTLAIYEAAKNTFASKGLFEWRLEKASTNSPLTVVALAEPYDPERDISPIVEKVNLQVAEGLMNLAENGQVAPWIEGETLQSVRSLLERNVNGIGSTEIDFGAGNVVSLDRVRAERAIVALAARYAIDVAESLPERQAFGEIEGVMVAAGHYKRSPAVQIKTDLYGFIWCLLSEKAIAKFGDQHTVSDIWKGKTVGVLGILNYATGGKLVKVEARDIREISSPLVDLDSILDPNFTAGMDPHDYLEKLHNGELS